MTISHVYSPITASTASPSPAEVAQDADELERWWSSPRFQNKTRPYSARDVAVLRCSPALRPTYPSNFQAKKLWSYFEHARHSGSFIPTFGALDPAQVVQMGKHLKTIYVSGWQCSSTASSSLEPGPDFADYPMNTVPLKVEQLFRAQLFHQTRINLSLLQSTTTIPTTT